MLLIVQFLYFLPLAERLKSNQFDLIYEILKSHVQFYIEGQL